MYYALWCSFNSNMRRQMLVPKKLDFLKDNKSWKITNTLTKCLTLGHRGEDLI